MKNLNIKTQEVREIEDPDISGPANRLFLDAVSLQVFIGLVQVLEALKFDFNGLHSRGWTIGRAALMKGDVSAVYALDRAGYNFALDQDALNYAKVAWHGSLWRAVAESAHRYDDTIKIPTLDETALREAMEMETPSFSGFSGPTINGLKL